MHRAWNRMFAGVAAAAFASTALAASAPAPVRPPYGPPLSLADAKAVVAAAEAKAKEINAFMVIAVAEPTGDMVLVQKMDGTQYSSFDIAMEKARSSARFRRPTKEFEDQVTSGRAALLGLPGALPIEGGLPLVRNGRLVGAIGLSGGTAVQDHQVAEAAAAALR